MTYLLTQSFTDKDLNTDLLDFISIYGISKLLSIDNKIIN